MIPVSWFPNHCPKLGKERMIVYAFRNDDELFVKPRGSLVLTPDAEFANQIVKAFGFELVAFNVSALITETKHLRQENDDLESKIFEIHGLFDEPDMSHERLIEVIRDILPKDD
jgi:hypothetical protein